LLLRDENRLGEAEPLMRRNLAILIHFARVNGYSPHDVLFALRRVFEDRAKYR